MALWKNMKKFAGNWSIQSSFSGLLFTFYFLLCLTGCSSQWSIRAEESVTNLQWPAPPEQPKVRFLMSVKGFDRERSAQTVLKTLVYGLQNEENNFGLPVAVSTGRDGRIAVGDIGRSCVHLYLPAERKYMRLTHAGDGEFRSPVGVAFDDDLRLYVADSFLGKVFVFGSDGIFLSEFGQVGNGGLKRPTGLAFGQENKLLYVVDTPASKVYVFNKEGKVVFSFGERGEEEAKFNYPTHIFLVGNGNLYVTDALNFRVEVFDSTGHFIRSFGRHGDRLGDIAMPKGIAADKGGTIYLADALFDTLQVFSPEGEFLFEVGSRGSENGEFWLPSGIFIDEGDKLYVCDPYNHRIQVFHILEKDEKKGL